MTKGYVIAHVSVDDPEPFRTYVENNGGVIDRHQGKILVKGGEAETTEGSSFDVHVVIEFPSYQHAQNFYNDPVYQEVAQFRRKSGRSLLILVEGAPAMVGA